MSEEAMESVWVFNASNAQFPGGVFSSRERAESWIAKHRLTGVLTEYPLDEGVYDWAVRQGLFSVKRPDQRTGVFIGGFSTARQRHVHYEDGES